MPTTFIGRTSITPTVFTGRQQGSGIVSTVSPIITGIWNDLNTWTETGKFWNDSGDIAGLVNPVYIGRIIP